VEPGGSWAATNRHHKTVISVDTNRAPERSTGMQIQVSGKQVDVGEALGSRITQELQDGIGKYFERGAQDAEVIVAKEGHSFKVDCWVRLASGQVVFTSGIAGDAHAAFTESLEKLEKRVRRYKRRLKDHHIGPPQLSPEKTEAAAREVARSIVLRDPDAVEDDVFGEPGRPDEPPPVGLVIAETEAEIRTVTVGRAVMELDMRATPSSSSAMLRTADSPWSIGARTETWAGSIQSAPPNP
jgi:ribosomal subunit interface protein